jgi:predicted ester cyclase
VTTAQDAFAQAVERFNDGDLDAYLELYDDAINLHGYGPEAMDKPAVRGFYESVFAAFDSLALDVHEVLWDGDAATVRFTMTGRHTGEFLGIPPTGRDIALAGISILHFAGDRVVERFAVSDMLGLLVQLGAIPAPA